MRIIVRPSKFKGIKTYEAHFGELATKIPAIFAKAGLKVEILRSEPTSISRAVFLEITLPKILVVQETLCPRSLTEEPKNIHFKDDETTIDGFGFEIYWLRQPKAGIKSVKLLIILTITYIAEPNIDEDFGEKLLEQFAQCLSRPWIRLRS